MCIIFPSLLTIPENGVFWRISEHERWQGTSAFEPLGAFQGATSTVDRPHPACLFV